MRTVFKYELPTWDPLSVTLHGPRVVHVGPDPAIDDHAPRVWIEHGDGDPETIRLGFVGTGHEIPADYTEHVGSAVCGPYVWHVYRVTS